LRVRLAIGSIALSGLLGGAVRAESADEGVVKMGGPKPVVQAAQAGADFGDPSATVTASPNVSQSQFVQLPQPFDNENAMAPRMADPYAPVYSDGVGYAISDDIERILYRVGNTTGDVYGVNGTGNGSYTNFNAFIPFASDGENALWYFQPRGSVTNNGQGIVNMGVGYRFWTPEEDRTYSGTFWWDGDGGHTKNFYNQLGAHFSSVGRYLSWRGGFALPVGTTRNTIASSVSDIFYVNSNIGFNILNNIQTAYQRYDLEAATPLPYLGRYGVEIGLGVYHLAANGVKSATGVSTRVEAQMTEDFWVNVLATSDNVFGGNCSMNLEWTLPDGAPSKWFRPKQPRDALFASDRRQYRVAVAQTKESTQSLAIDPRTGQPILIAHIDPNLTAPGDGTIENPFNSVQGFTDLADAQQSQYGIIFVRRNEDGSDNNLNTTITLFDAQRLLGDGTLPGGGVHQFDALINGNLQHFVLPGQTAGLLPLLTNSAATNLDVVTLANSNEVAGFTIDASGTAAGIRGTGINGFNIHANGIRNVVDGIVITSDTTVATTLPLAGIGIIENNLGEDLNGNGVLDANEDLDGDGEIDGISGNGFGSNRGVSVTQVAGDLNLRIRNNDVRNFNGEDRNGNNLLDPSEDLNLNGVLDPGEDTNSNGQLDLAEDVNNNGALDRGVGIEVIADGGTIHADAPTDVTLPTGVFNNRIIGNGVGLSMTANAAGTIFADIRNNSILDSTQVGPDGAGVELISNGGVFSVTNFRNNIVTGNAFRGGNFIAQNGGTLTFDDGTADTASIANNLFANNGDDGLRIAADNGAVLIDQLANNIFGTEDLNLNGALDEGEDLNGNGALDGGNGNNGLTLATLNNGIINVANPIADNLFNANLEDGLNLNANSGSISLQFGTGNEFRNNGGNGASFNTSNGGIINSGLTGIVATGNDEAGVEFNLDGGTVTLSDIRGNQFNNNNIGLAIINSNGGTFVTPTVAENQFNNNTQAGLFIGGLGGATTAQTNLGTVINNQFNRQTTGFYGIQFASTDVATLATLRQNQFIGAGANSGPGIGGVVDGTGGVTLDLAPNLAQNGNLFSNNGDAHIGLVLSGQTVNTINIANHVFENAVDSTNVTFGSNLFGGDGVAFILQQESSLTGSVKSSDFENNSGDGFRADIQSTSLTGFATLNNFTIGGPDATEGNIFDGNHDDGIQVSRTGAGQVNNVTIQNNIIRNTGDGILNSTATYLADNGQYTEVIDGNPGETNVGGWSTQGDDAIYIAARGVTTQDTYHILDNQITNNTDNGVQLHISGDASLNVEMRRNLIDGNGAVANGATGGNGIAMTEEAASPVTELDFITGVFTDNTITNNTANGIYEAAATDGLVIGAAGATFSNIITGNGLNGVAITGIDSPQNSLGAIRPAFLNAFSTKYLNNLVANNTGALNGRNDPNAAEQAGHGFDIDTTPGKVIIIDSNEIRNNAHDGIEFQNGVRQNLGSAAVVQILNSTIEFNGDRGIDILNKTDGVGAVSSILVIDGNNISNNQEEGIQIVNTNSGTQRQNVSSSVNLTEDGSIGQQAFLQLTFRNNLILGNGVNVDQNPAGAAPGGPIRASGLVLRVGTSGGDYGAFFDGGFASFGVFGEDFNHNGVLDPGEDLNNDGVLQVGFIDGTGLINAGVLAEITNNQFAGNFGDDMFIHSFRSTVDPGGTAGAWSTTEFRIDAYHGDPLARLDLVYGNNTFDTAELTPRLIVPHPGTTDGDTGAYYNNAEAEFKSRTIRNDASTGPFNNASRRRNAQRLGARWTLPPQPGTDGGNFLYPGMGDSTFRVHGVGNLAGNPLQALEDEGFDLDDFPFGDGPPMEDWSDADGTPFNPGVFFGELPFGWGTF
jgi:hypothetical protein